MDELREKIAKLLAGAENDPTIWKDTGQLQKNWYLSEADQIHKLYKEAGYVKLAEDQSLLDSPWAKEADAGDMYAQSRTSGYYCAQDDMFGQGWRKVEL